MSLDPRADSAGTVFGFAKHHAVLEGDVAGLVQFLTEIEAGEKALSVENLTVTRPTLAYDYHAPEVLRIEVEVKGLFLLGDDR